MNNKDVFLEWKENRNIVPVELPHKEEYLDALTNIENSWTGRLDAQIANTFIQEAGQMICNSIVLFERGYFDCAYYSLRQSIEIATTMIYLSDIPDDMRRKELQAWREIKDFPMQGQMLSFLKKNGSLFVDMKDNLSFYFEDLSVISKKLNKFVHKQGFQNFYVARNHPTFDLSKHIKNYISEFESYIVKAIGALAVMRLAIDPYPILLMDEEIYMRTGDTITEAYSESFVTKYIDTKVLEAYKCTEIYMGYYEHYIQNEERKLDCVANVVKHQYIDKQQIELIFSQLHLLGQDDFNAVNLVMWCKKATKVYCHNGMLYYFTNENTNRKAHGWRGMDFERFKNNEDKFNQRYDEAFISVFEVNNSVYYLEHNDPLDNDEITFISNNIKRIENEE